MEKALGEHRRDLDEDAELRHARHDAVEHLADAVLQELDLLELHRLALGLGGFALARRAVRRSLFEDGDVCVRPTREVAAGEAVDDEVRVAPNRAREVRIEAEREAVVPAVVRRVDRLRHRPQGRHRDHRLLVGPLDALDQGGEVARGGRAARERQAKAEGLDVVGEGRDALRVGRFVDAVEERAGLEARRGGAVGGEHEGLDEPVRRLARLADDADGVALLVEDDLDLVAVEVDGAVAHPALGEGFGDAVGEVQVRPEVVVGLAVEHRLRAFVGEALVRVDDAVEELRRQHLAVFHAHGHDAREDQPVLARHERADAVGEVLGQHRDDAVDEIRARRAHIGLAVERRPLAHVVAHVGDVNADLDGPVALVDDVDGVVEVLGVDRVDGEDAGLAEVAAALDLVRGDAVGDGSSLGLDIAREVGADAVGEREREHAHRRVGRLAEHLGDGAFEAVVGRLAVVLDADDDLVAIFGAAAIALAHPRAARDAGIVGADEAAAALGRVRPDHARPPALDHLCHDRLASLRIRRSA